MSAPAPASAASRKRKVANPFFSAEILDAYETHVKRLKEVHEMRKESTSLRNVATDVEVVESMDVWDTLGKKQPSDKFNGCTNLRTLRSLLKIIDERGFERCVLALYSVVLESLITNCCRLHVHRSEHQMQFHSAFERCVSRVIYKVSVNQFLDIIHSKFLTLWLLCCRESGAETEPQSCSTMDGKRPTPK